MTVTATKMASRLPPVEKIFEAWSAIASGRAKLDPGSDSSAGSLSVRSSGGDHIWHVSWKDNSYSSDDNATWWQAYAGYPILCALMLNGRLPYNSEEGKFFSGVNWNDANKKAGRDYAKALADVCSGLGLNEEVIKNLLERARQTLADFEKLGIATGRLRKASPAQDRKIK